MDEYKRAIKFEKDVNNYETIVGELLDKLYIDGFDYSHLATSLISEDRKTVLDAIIECIDRLDNQQRRFVDMYFFTTSEALDCEKYTLLYEKYFLSIGNNEPKIEMRYVDDGGGAGGYSPSSAVYYANKYYLIFNTGTYPDLSKIGGDCANFVSQALYYGGMKMDNEWSIYKKNSTYLTPRSTTELDYSWILAQPSSPWISAKRFDVYWSNRSIGISTYSVSSYLSLSDKTPQDIGKGDVVQILKKSGFAYYGFHTMLITNEPIYSNYTYTAHSSSRKNYNLTNALNTYNNSNYKVRFFKMSY